MRKRILVSGGAGFIGSYLCEALLMRGDEVICIDDCTTGTRRNVCSLLDHDAFEFIHHDVTSPIEVEVDEIYNLACPASPFQYQRDPLRTIRTSVLGAINLLELAKRCGAKIFQASTSEIYGDAVAHPQSETYWGNVNPIGPRACYNEGKRCAETLFFDYRKQHDVRIRVARIFNTYGPRMQRHDGRVVSNFVTQALANKPLLIFGDGMQSRSFCYVEDLADACIRLMGIPDDALGPVNLGNPAEISIADLAAVIVDLTGSKSAIEHRPLPEDDPKRRCPDISLARRKLNWEPTTSLSDGLARTIDFFRGGRSAERR